LANQADRAAVLAKADLLTDMVGEFPELQGIMGRYYALHDGESAEVADAIEDHYKPRFAGDELPRGDVGLCVALADKLQTLADMFGIGQLPTGDKDPFALRRHALGMIRMLIERDLPLDLAWLFGAAKLVDAKVVEQLSEFIYERLAGSLREQGYSALEVDAVVGLRPQRLGDIPKRLAAVRAFAALPEAASLAAANKRVGNILKKAEGRRGGEGRSGAAQGSRRNRAEQGARLGETRGRCRLRTRRLHRLAAGAGGAEGAGGRFFDGVMVNAEDAQLRANRLGLLATLHQAMNRVADLSRLSA
jgi:glycyl-tRNA synthetase beta chain